MNADGSDVRAVRVDGNYHEAPQWTPDGRRIVFTANQYGHLDLFVMDADGRNVQRLTDHPSDDMHPTMSPDGVEIAFISDRDGPPSLYILDLQPLRERRILYNEDSEYASPAYSPDGAALAIVTTDYFSESSLSSVTVIPRRDPEAMRDLTTITDIFLSNLSWSPEGDAVAYLAYDAWNTGQRSIYVVGRENGSLQRLTNTDENVDSFNWSVPGTTNVLTNSQSRLSDIAESPTSTSDGPERVISGYLPYGDRLFHTFSANAGDVVTVSLEGEFDTFLELHQVDRPELRVDDDGGEGLNS